MLNNLVQTEHQHYWELLTELELLHNSELIAKFEYDSLLPDLPVLQESRRKILKLGLASAPTSDQKSEAATEHSVAIRGSPDVQMASPPISARRTASKGGVVSPAGRRSKAKAELPSEGAGSGGQDDSYFGIGLVDLEHFKNPSLPRAVIEAMIVPNADGTHNLESAHAVSIGPLASARKILAPSSHPNAASGSLAVSQAGKVASPSVYNLDNKFKEVQEKLD